MTRVVLDASVAMKWFLDEEYSTESRALLAADVRFLVPDFFYAETANVFWKRLLRGDLTRTKAFEGIAELAVIPTEVHESKPLTTPALTIASNIAVAVYDAIYVALALRSDCVVVTADRKLFAKLASTPYASALFWIGDAVSLVRSRLH